jgi:hypothetical protein
VRVSLSKWANRDIALKTDAQAVLEDLRAAIRAGTFDPRGQVVREITPMTFREFAEICKERHAVARGLSLARTIDWRLRPLLERFGDRALADIKTADVEDFIADLRKPRIVGRELVPRSITAASVNRTVELLRHMMNWAVGREYIDRTPFRRGSETLIIGRSPPDAFFSTLLEPTSRTAPLDGKAGVGIGAGRGWPRPGSAGARDVEVEWSEPGRSQPDSPRGDTRQRRSLPRRCLRQLEGIPTGSSSGPHRSAHADGPRVRQPRATTMFLFARNTFSGSHASFTRASRPQFPR